MLCLMFCGLLYVFILAVLYSTLDQPVVVWKCFINKEEIFQEPFTSAVSAYSTETSTFLSLDFTEILHIRVTMFLYLKLTNMLFEQLHLSEPSKWHYF